MRPSFANRAVANRAVAQAIASRRGVALVVGMLALFGARCPAVETIAYTLDDQPRSLAGRVLVRDDAGGRLLLAPDGLLELIPGDAVRSASEDDLPFQPLSVDQAADRLLAELPSGFQAYKTERCVVAYNTSRDFAKWTASLVERLRRAFVSFWSKKGFDLAEPELPLVVVIYADEASYRRASAAELGDARGVVGYYSLRTNRVTMYDLTGSEEARGGGGRRGSLKEINQMLATPGAAPLVATIVHEATHQIAFNTGLHQRYADVPLWLLEGMAVYFEAPDLSSSRGWRGIGKVNHARLDTFRRNLPAWGPAALRGLVADSRRFRDPRTAADAYADAWALNYYLIKQRPKQYVAYLEAQRDKPPLAETTAEQKVAEFELHFGPLEEVQRTFLRQMSRVR